MTPSQVLPRCMTVAGAMLMLAIGQPAMANEAAWQALKAGGQVVLMRHTSPEHGPGKGNALLRDASCAKERNLSPQGKQEAARIGEAFRSHGIAVGEVLASPYCRTLDTARIAFGQANPVEFLSLSEVLPPATNKCNIEEVMKKIGGYRGAPNLIMVTHEPNITSIAFDLIEQGAFLILKPRGGSEFEVAGKIRLEELAD